MELIKSKIIRHQITGFFSPIWQVFRSVPRKYTDILIFLILPITYLLNAYILHRFQGSFFLGLVDPEYFYLYNGVVLSDGNLSLQYIAHPGIPLQYLIALSTSIISFFQPGEKIKDFIDDPEKYIHAANLLMNMLVALVLFICGIKSKKYSGSYFTALLFQLSPFGSAALLGLSRRLIPESIMIIPLLLTGLMIIKHVYNENKTRSSLTDVILFGAIIGFGTACKLSFLPILVIPLILLKINLKQKVQLVLYTLLFFIIFAYPVIFNFNQFWQWVAGIVTHTGKYGGGETGLIDLTTLPENIKMLFDTDPVFIYIAASSLVLSGLLSLKQFKDQGFTNNALSRAMLAVNAGLLVCIAFILKHFSVYYFFPFYIFKYILVLLSVLMIVQYNKISGSKRVQAIILSVAAIFVLFITYRQAGEVRSSITDFNKRSQVLQQDYEQIHSLIEKDKPVIMSAAYYGAPFIEFAHFSGYIMTGHLRHCFTPYLKEKFPMSYEFVNWNDKFYFWGDLVDFQAIPDKSPTSFYIYIGDGRGNDLKTIEERIWKVLDKNKAVRKVLFKDDNTGEQLLEIIPDSRFQIPI